MSAVKSHFTVESWQWVRRDATSCALHSTRKGVTSRVVKVDCVSWSSYGAENASESISIKQGELLHPASVEPSYWRLLSWFSSGVRSVGRGSGAMKGMGGSMLFRRTSVLLAPANHNNNPHNGTNDRGSDQSSLSSVESTDGANQGARLIENSEEYDLHQELAATFVETEEGTGDVGRRDHRQVGESNTRSGGLGGWGVSLQSTSAGDGSTGTSSEGPGMGMPSGLKRIHLVRLDRPPGRFDLLTNSLAYAWHTTAGLARKVSGPLREWAAELKYRTGVHLELEPSNPSRLSLSREEGGYQHSDEVEITVFLFGSERGIFNCAQLMESIIDQEPSYVRLAVFRRAGRTPFSGAVGGTGAISPSSGMEGVKGKNAGDKEGGGPSDDGVGSGNGLTDREEVEWLLLRRINRELRPPDIPPISLKLPGKHTLLYEQYKEAAIRTLWEETGITVEASKVFPTGRLFQDHPEYYWRVPVHYFVAEVPYDVEVKGPQTDVHMYMRDWDKKLLQQSPDPIDRAWAAFADPETGCAWLRRPMIDELQREWRGDDYMRIRYTPPPYSELGDVVGLTAEEE